MVDEYKKFVFLAVTADHLVVPSGAVEQVWQLHLAHSRAYWHYFCPQVLETSLHYEPVIAEGAEGEAFKLGYEQTLESYKNTFKAAPPEEIWPSPKLRFERDFYFVRINTQQFWTLPKLPISRTRVSAIAAVSMSAVGWVCIHAVDPNLHPIGQLLSTMFCAASGYGLVQTIAKTLDRFTPSHLPVICEVVLNGEQRLICFFAL